MNNFKRMSMPLHPDAKPWGWVDRNFIAFIPKGASSAEVEQVANLLARHITQEAQLAELEGLSKLMPEE